MNDYHATHIEGNLWAIVPIDGGIYQTIYVRASNALEALINAKVWLCKY